MLLSIGLLAFALLSFGLAGLRVIELRPTAYDLGLYQQALWTGAHGGSYYEAPDWQSAGFPTFLEVHLSLLMAGLAPLYSVAPGPFILIAVQSIAVSLAALPLYLLARDVRGSPSDGLIAAGLYLVWGPLLAGTLFDFHLEAFLPLGLFGFLWLWRRGRYVPALLAAFLVAAIAEFALPVLAFLALYEAWRSYPPRDTGGGSWGPRLLVWIRQPAVGLSLLVAVFSVIWLAVLLTFQAEISILIPTPGGSMAPGVSSADLASTYHISVANLANALWTKLADWLLLYALLGFLPWAAPRSQLVALPWATVSLLHPGAELATPGNQYAFFLAIPLFVGVVDGLPRFLSWLGASSLAPTGTPSPRAHRQVAHPAVLPILVGALVAANLVLSPIDPLVQQAADLGPGYGVSYLTSGSYADARKVVDLLSPGATLVASTDLFPLVANDPNAYVLTGPVSPSGFSHLPFGEGNLPPAVLLSQDRLNDVPSWLAQTVYNWSFYHLCAIAWDAPVGSVLLFEGRGTAGPCSNATFEYGPVPPRVLHFDPADFVPGPAAGPFPPKTEPAPTRIVSVPGQDGNVWHGPYASLVPGEYILFVSVRGLPWPTSPPPTNATPVLELTVTAFGQAAWVREAVEYGAISPTSDGQLIASFNVTSPSVNVEIVGDQTSLEGYLEFYGATLVRFS